MHDNYITGYRINIKEKTLIIQTYNEAKREEKNIYFSEVLTHSFACILEYNQILDVDEHEICNFIKDNQEALKKWKGHCWPVDYKSEQELECFLEMNNYKYIKILSSYGMSGWVLAKSYQIGN